ncbi:glucose-1-phosphate thymidylyltransferase RfbA [Streptomyces sp. NPDC056796]|uniref:glucose-1-phosphate thymidylyltransferase RfbA n=1 Tax=unclassified Streptomyces TaxID=2593676 RepID=UPI0036BCEDED
MRGIVLAGGAGTRLRPVTGITSKQLLPVYNKPMVYYPLSVLMHAGIREILIISSPRFVGAFKELLGDGHRIGLDLHYASQPHPDGLADALRIGRDFIGDEQIALVLGDNIFYGHQLPTILQRERERLSGCTLFGYPVADPERYGIAGLDEDGKILSIKEKPDKPTSNLAVTGLYLYDNDALAMATELTPSPRGELEITDLNLRYVEDDRARLVNLGRGSAWFDTGTHDSLLEAATFVQIIEKRQGIRIACIEEIAYRMGFIDSVQLSAIGDSLGPSSDYGQYILDLAAA